MATGLVSWSQTAANNATADTNVNWAEGQAPSSVNDSGRGMMASLAKWRDDNAGSLVTAGTSTAYTLTSNQVFASLAAMSGQSLRVKFNATNGAAPTLNVDGLGAKAIHTVAGTAIGTASIQVNSIYDLVYDNANSCWVLIAGQKAGYLDAPSGTVMLFGQTAAPTGWTKDASNFNNSALRVVTGAASSGGTANFTTAFAARTILQTDLPNVGLSIAGGVATPTVTATPANAAIAAFTSGQAAGGAGSSNFLTSASLAALSIALSGNTASMNTGVTQTTMDFAVKYVDVIRATKD
jgi:hypothetical protein